jgi:hypothetical protein
MENHPGMMVFVCIAVDLIPSICYVGVGWIYKPTKINVPRTGIRIMSWLVKTRLLV